VSDPFLWILSFLRRAAGVPNEGHPARPGAVQRGNDGRSPSIWAVTLSNKNGPSRSRPYLPTMAATKLALRVLGERCAALDTELARLDAELDHLTAQAAPRLRQLCGVGPEIAGALLVAAGDNPRRLHSEAAFSMLCGASPIPASSGKTVRHRLSRGGNRQANTALYRIVVVRLCWHQPTRDYLIRRTKEGLSK
jgi:transposase